MHGNQSREIGTDLTEFDRRSFLRASVGTGIASTVGLTGSASAQETSGGDGIWKFETDDFVVSSPTVVDETVYFGSNDGTVYAVDAETGEEEWAFTEPEDWVRSSPNVTNGTVYMGSDDQNLYAIDQSSGEQEWVYEAGVSDQSSPTVVEGVVYIVGSGIYALDAETGNEIWTLESIRQEDSYAFYASLTVVDNVVYVGTSGITDRESDEYGTNAAVYAIDVETGEEIWVSEVADGDIRTTPTVLNNTLYVGAEDGFLYAINTDSGEIDWTFETKGEASVSPTVFDGTVFIGTSEEYEENEWRGTLHAVSAETGEEEWRYETGDTDFVTNIGSSPTVAGGTVFFGAFGLIAVDAKTGDELWRFGPSNARSSPTVVDGVAFVGMDDESLYAIDAGVDGSSADSRVLQGTLGHHHEWAGQSSQSLDPVVSYSEEDEDENGGSNPASTVFRNFTGSNSSPLLWALVGLGTVGGAYAGYKKLSATDDSIESDTLPATDHSVEPVEDTEITIYEYDEIQIGETITETSDYQLQQGQIGDHHFWVLKPLLEDAETVSTAVFEAFSESVDPWAGMDSHPHLVNVLGTGSEPIPWAAIENADDSTLLEQVDRLSLAETIEAIQEVCEALHHVHRYGTVYENLTTESVLYTDDEGVTLRGVLDQFDEPDPWYNAPEEFDGESTEQSTVYRVGLIAYELLTGTLPYSAYPNGDPKSKIQSHELISPSERVATLPEEVDEILLTALSAAPGDRYETVLHLRDELSEI